MMRRSLVLLIAAMMAVTLKIQVPEVSAAENTESVAGLYIGKSSANSGPYKIHGRYFQDHYEYLFPDGTFYNGLIMQGYDDLNLAEYLSFQHPLRVEQDAGRYVVDGDQVTFLKAGGKKTTLTLRGNTFGSGDNKLVRQPNYDGLTLSGTYELLALRNTGITFTPDGRFVDRGAMPFILNLTDSRLDSPARTLRPGPGTYSIKNYTITLRYAHGPVFRLFFYVNGDDRGEIDLSMIHIYTYELSRLGGSPAEQSSTPTARLPKFEVPQGWKSQRDPTQKTTNLVPLNLPQGQALAVAIADPQPLINQEVSHFPGRIHDGVVQGAVKNYASLGYRTVKEMKRDTQGKILSSSGVFDQPNGKRLWITIFTFVSSAEGHIVVLISDHENLYKTHLPTVQAMLGDGDSPPAPSIVNLSPIATVAHLPEIKVPQGWKIRRNPSDKVPMTQLIAPAHPEGQMSLVLVTNPQPIQNSKAVSSPERVHEGVVAAVVRDTIALGNRIETAMSLDASDKILSSTGVIAQPDGIRLWTTIFTFLSSSESQSVSYMSSREDVHKANLPTVKSMLGEGDASLRARMTTLDSLLSKVSVKSNALRSWTIEYDPKDKSTGFTPPDLPSGQIVVVSVDDRVQRTSSLAQAHDEMVGKILQDADGQQARLEGTTKREQRENAFISTMVFVHPSGMKLWVTAISTSVGREVQAVGLFTNSEALHKQYLPTAKEALAELVGR